jgi:transposase
MSTVCCEDPVCCGLDIHRMKISACLITIDSDSNEPSEIREFGAFTGDSKLSR